jgi:outer membrane protein assembly factor BamA
MVYENNLSGIEKANQEELLSLIEQEPNTRFFGTSIGVLIYRFGESFYDSIKVVEELKAVNQELSQVRAQIDTASSSLRLRKKEDKLKTKAEGLQDKLEYGNALMKTGNPLVILDSALLEKTYRNMQGYLVNHGFFDSKVNFSVDVEKQKATINYLIKENTPYLIDSIYTRSDNPEILKLLSQYSRNAQIKQGEIYNQDHIAAERNRLEDLLKNNGFYMFSKSYVNYLAYQDTSAKTIRLEQVIQKPTFTDKHEVYTIDSINFQINPPSDVFADRRVKTNYSGIDFSFYRDRYSAKVLASRIRIQKGTPYSRTQAIETQRLLNNLDIFRFVNITFDTLGTSLTANILTQPNQKFQLTNQLGMTITEQLPGPFFSTALRNRNFFRAGEILEFNFRAGLEGVASATGQGVYQSSELNTSVSVIFPRFLIPFSPGTLQRFGRYNPNTRVTFGYLNTSRPEYKRNAINGLLSYTRSKSSRLPSPDTGASSCKEVFLIRKNTCTHTIRTSHSKVESIGEGLFFIYRIVPSKINLPFEPLKVCVFDAWFIIAFCIDKVQGSSTAFSK